MSGIHLKNVRLNYDIHYDRSSSLKELVINLLHRRKYVEKRRDTLNALNDFSLSVREGERLGIIGRNGAGKSTLLKVISGILKPSAGEVIVEGAVQPLIEIAAGFNPEFSGRENIYLNGYMLGFTKEQLAAKEKEIIDFSELHEFIDVPVKYYSSGMSVRLAFTIATAVSPHYLIFDEMLAAGDASFIEKAKRRMDDLIGRAKIVIVVSHSLEFIESFCTRCLVIERGQIVFDGPSKDAIAFYLNMVRPTNEVKEAEHIFLDQLDDTESGLRVSGHFNFMKSGSVRFEIHETTKSVMKMESGYSEVQDGHFVVSFSNRHLEVAEKTTVLNVIGTQDEKIVAIQLPDIKKT